MGIDEPGNDRETVAVDDLGAPVAGLAHGGVVAHGDDRPRRATRRRSPTAAPDRACVFARRARPCRRSCASGRAYRHDCADGGEPDEPLARGCDLRGHLRPDRDLVRRAGAHGRYLAPHDLRDVARRVRGRRAVPRHRHDRLGRHAARSRRRRHRPERPPPALRPRGRAVPARPAVEARALEPDRARRVHGARARAADARARPPRVLRLRLHAVRGLEPRHARRCARGRRDRRPLGARPGRGVPGQHARAARPAPAPARRARRRARGRRRSRSPPRPSPPPACPSCWPRRACSRRASPARSRHDLVGGASRSPPGPTPPRPPGRSRSAGGRCRRRCSAC